MLKAIEKIIKSNVEDFCRDISIKYQIPYDELVNIWKGSHNEKVKQRKVESVSTDEPSISSSSTDEPSISSSSTDEPSISSSSTDEPSISSEDEQKCPKIMKKGKNKGKKCGNKPRKNCIYCSKHKNFEGTLEEEPIRQNVPDIPSNTVNRMKWVIHPVLNLWWDPNTSFIKKSENDDIIIGKCVDNKRVKLSDKDKKLCTSKNLTYIAEEEVEVIQEELLEEESRDVKSEIMKTLFGNDDIENVLSEIQD